MEYGHKLFINSQALLFNYIILLYNSLWVSLFSDGDTRIFILLNFSFHLANTHIRCSYIYIHIGSKNLIWNSFDINCFLKYTFTSVTSRMSQVFTQQFCFFCPIYFNMLSRNLSFQPLMLCKIGSNSERGKSRTLAVLHFQGRKKCTLAG